MQSTVKHLTDTKAELIISADRMLMQATKASVLEALRPRVKIAGFRQGKAPLPMVEKSVDPSTLQTEFLDRAVNELYIAAIQQEKLKPVARPEVAIQKFVPFTDLEIKATVDVVGKAKLPDYKKIKLAKKPIKITDKDIDEVIEALRTRTAERKTVERAAKSGDEATIDFSGVDAKTEKPISGADGKAYPLVLGSDNFIPGFEKNLIGAKPEETKAFTLTFPDDYGVSGLRSKEVTFTVTIKKITELVKPKVDDDFATKAGPFKSLKELKEDITKQLQTDRQQQADRDYESDLLEKLSDKATVPIPDSLVDEEVDRLIDDERQNIMYRGQTWQEFLDSEGQTEDEHRAAKHESAERRVKAGLLLAEIAEQEGIDVSPEEINTRLELLKGQYTDKRMQDELDKPETRRDIAGRMITEKTIAKLVEYANQ